MKENLKGKIVLAHSGWFDAASTQSYKGNSKEICAISTHKNHVSIIELDVRKSSDGILYCYHGTFLQYFVFLKIRRPFADLKRRYEVDSLPEILDVIGADKSVFLDIKDSQITKEDILNAFEGRVFKEVILGNKSVSYLTRFYDMPQNFVKIINGNIFCNFYNLRRLKENNFKYFEVVFPFQVRKGIVERVAWAGMEFRLSGLFLSTKKYWRIIEKYGIRHVSSDFV